MTVIKDLNGAPDRALNSTYIGQQGTERGAPLVLPHVAPEQRRGEGYIYCQYGGTAAPQRGGQSQHFYIGMISGISTVKTTGRMAPP